MPLEPALVAPQPLFDPLGRLVEGQGRLGARPRCLQYDAGVKVNRALAAEKRPLSLENDETGEAAVEILLDSLADAVGDPRSKRLSDVHVLSRDPEAHRDPPIRSIAREMPLSGPPARRPRPSKGAATPKSTGEGRGGTYRL